MSSFLVGSVAWYSTDEVIATLPAVNSAKLFEQSKNSTCFNAVYPSASVTVISIGQIPIFVSVISFILN